MLHSYTCDAIEHGPGRSSQATVYLQARAKTAPQNRQTHTAMLTFFRFSASSMGNP